MKKKVILLTEVISPYRIPVFNELSYYLQNSFLVLFFSETVKEREWKIYYRKIRFNYKVLLSFSFQRKTDTFPYFFNPTLFFRLVQYSPEIIIIGGYHHLSCLIALLYTKFFKRRIILWCETNKYGYRLNYPLKETYKRWFVKNCTGYIVPGKASYEYLLSLGAAVEKIWVAPNAVDNDYFSQTCNKYIETKETFKESKGYPKTLILYVGRLIDRKGIFVLLKAFQILSQEQSDLGLLLIGSGEGKKQYKDFCKTNNIKNVFFEGFVHQEELPAYYAMADVFVLPSYSEPWGLVLNEAMACKLPVISSNIVGAAEDLIINGKNGYIFNVGDIHKLVNCLEDILSDEQKRTGMGQMSLNIIRNYSPLKCAQGFIQAIREI